MGSGRWGKRKIRGGGVGSKRTSPGRAWTRHRSGRRRRIRGDYRHAGGFARHDLRRVCGHGHDHRVGVQIDGDFRVAGGACARHGNRERGNVADATGIITVRLTTQVPSTLGAVKTASATEGLVSVPGVLAFAPTLPQVGVQTNFSSAVSPASGSCATAFNLMVSP